MERRKIGVAWRERRLASSEHVSFDRRCWNRLAALSAKIELFHFVENDFESLSCWCKNTVVCGLKASKVGEQNQATFSCVSVLALSTLHSVLGEGFGLSGSISCTLDDLENDAVCEVSFPMAELSFGDKLRNWQLHRHLDTKQWPQATFSLGVTRVISKSTCGSIR